VAEKTLVVAGQGLELTGSRSHGHVAAVHAQAKALRRPEIGLHLPVEEPLAETIGQAAEGSGSSRLPFEGYRKVGEANARSVGRVAEGVPPEQATANSGPGQDVGYHLPDLSQRRARGCRRCRHRDPGRGRMPRLQQSG